jgi:hypothetical protein
MGAESEPAVSESSELHCWCCDKEFAEASLVRLGSRPEVTICLDCARFLNRRALARRQEQRWTPMGVVRGAVQHGRDRVIENGWHTRGPLGAFLRRIDRFLP